MTNDVALAKETAPHRTTPPLPQENIYGHVQRVDWMRRHMRPGDRILELGCGTGYMITLPLKVAGYDVLGVDIDEQSIKAGQQIMREFGVSPHILRACDLADIDEKVDVLILSEVIEHLTDNELRGMLALAREKLVPGGRLLITTPNGYGWFELEAFLWKHIRWDDWREQRRWLTRPIQRAQAQVIPEDRRPELPSTLSSTPHLQRFTWRSLHRVLESAGFKVVDARGSVVASGPFSNLLLTGIEPVMRWNARIGSRGRRIVSGFYIAAESPWTRSVPDRGRPDSGF